MTSRWSMDPDLQLPKSLHSLELDMKLVVNVMKPITPSKLAECINTFPAEQSHLRHLTLRIPAEMMIYFKKLAPYELEDSLNELESALSRFQTVHWSTAFMVYRKVARKSDLGSRDKIHMHLDLRDRFATFIEEGRLILSQEDFKHGVHGDAHDDFRILNDRFGH